MPDYVETGTQTIWAGLMQKETVRPAALLSPPPDTATPPDDMLTDKAQFMYGGVVPATPPQQLQQPQPDDQHTPEASTLLDRRQNRMGLPAHLSLPTNEVPYAPPSTNALLSPIPEANRRHAGHTPLYPRALSPEPEAEEALAKEQPIEQQADNDGHATPDQDEGLKGALTLPPNPVDGAEDYIGLDALDHRLGKIARQQAILRGEFDDEPEPKPKAELKVQVPAASDDGLPLSRKCSADSRRSGATDEVDGVILKTPPSNFGAPFGQL